MIRARLWPHFRFDPEVLWEREAEEHDRLLSELEYERERDPSMFDDEERGVA